MRKRPPLREQVADLRAQLRDLSKLGRAMREAQSDVAAEARYAKRVADDSRIANREPAVSAARLRAEGLAREFDRRSARILEGPQTREVAHA